MPASSSTEPFAQLGLEDLTLLRALVWQVLRHAVKTGEFKLPTPPESQTLLRTGASFVSFYVDGQLRGCTGSIEAETALWLDVCKRTYTTTQDSRFAPLELEELPQLTFKISILTPLSPRENNGESSLLQQLKPNIDGLVLADRYRRSVFLPTVWQSLPEPADFVAALKNKGGWPVDYWSEDIRLYLFHTFEYES